MPSLFENQNKKQGWGHVIDNSDIWKSTKWKNGTNWTFYGAQADQVSHYLERNAK